MFSCTHKPDIYTMLLFTLLPIMEIFILGYVCVKIFTKLSMGWCKSNTCLVGKTVIVTGGNSGLGYETALGLAARGGKVIIADVADTRSSVSKIKEETGNTNVIGMFLDLASLKSVRSFAEEICAKESRLDILINNAGVGGMPLRHTEDGLQIHMQINYFGHFLLTHLLLESLKKTKGKIIFISSIAAFANNLTLENLNQPTIFSFEGKTHWTIYCNSKLCDLIASNVFAEKLRSFGIMCNAVYPGIVTTSLITNSVDPQFHKWSKVFLNMVWKIFGKSSFEGAQTQINCALAKDLEYVSGEFFVDCTPFYQPSLAKNKEFCKQIWQRSEELVQLKPNEKLD